MKAQKRFVPVSADFDEDADDNGQPTHEEIAVVAHQIYEEEGCPSGLADSHWHAAEARLQQ